MTVRDVVREKNLRKKTPTKPKDANLLSVEENLRGVLETKIVIKKRGQRGKILIDFYSDEEFKELVRKLKKIRSQIFNTDDKKSA